MHFFEQKFKEYLTEAEEKGKLQKIFDRLMSKYFTDSKAEEVKNDLEKNQQLSDSISKFYKEYMDGEDSTISSIYKLYKDGDRGIEKSLGKEAFDNITSYLKTKFNI